MKRANSEVYDKLGKVRKEVVRKSNSLRNEAVKSKAKQDKAVDRVRQKYERAVVLAVDAATSATTFEIKQVLPNQTLSLSVTLSLTRTQFFIV
jgi:RNA polymerase-binding transcription factor DksA